MGIITDLVIPAIKKRTRQAILQRLFTLGYFPEHTWDEVKTFLFDLNVVKDAIATFQQMAGTAVDGRFSEHDETKLFSATRCGLPDMMLAEARTCKWPMREVKYLERLQLPQMTRDEVRRAYKLACDQWNAVCNIQLVLTEDATQANIIADSGTGRSVNLDGPGGTLAWSELPCGASPRSKLQQMYDTREDWSFDMLVAVACHEVGHALGFDHGAAGTLMAAYFNNRIMKPQAADIAVAQKVYGTPTTQPPPVNPPPAPTEKTYVLRVTGSLAVDGYELFAKPR